MTAFAEVLRARIMQKAFGERGFRLKTADEML